MTALVVVVLLVETVVAAVLGWVAVLLHRRADAVRRAEIDARPAVDDGIDGRRTSCAHPVLAVEILNAPELAARESWAARRIGALLPRVVGREVAAQAAERMAEQLAEQGVRAQVRIVAPRQP